MIEELDYVQQEDDLFCTATTEAGADTHITSGAVTVDGSEWIVVEFFSTAWGQDSTTPTNNLALFDNGTTMGAFFSARAFQTPWAQPLGLFRFRLVPSGGSHTYSVRAWTSSDTFQVAGGIPDSGGDAPCYLRIYRVVAEGGVTGAWLSL